MIRRLFIIGLFLLGGLASLEAQITRSLRAPVDFIPDFVKEKVSPVNGGTFSKSPSWIFNHKAGFGSYVDVKESGVLTVSFNGLFQYEAEGFPEEQCENIRKEVGIRLDDSVE